MKTYKMSAHIRKYYDKWVYSETLLDLPNIGKFYNFIKVCVKHQGKKYWNGHRLRYFLEQDIPQRYDNEDYAEQMIRQAVSIFDHILSYERASGYDYWLEIKSPYEYKTALSNLRNAKNEPLYTDQQVEFEVSHKYGIDWKRKY